MGKAYPPCASERRQFFKTVRNRRKLAWPAFRASAPASEPPSSPVWCPTACAPLAFSIPTPPSDLSLDDPYRDFTTTRTVLLHPDFSFLPAAGRYSVPCAGERHCYSGNALSTAIIAPTEVLKRRGHLSCDPLRDIDNALSDGSGSQAVHIIAPFSAGLGFGDRRSHIATAPSERT